MIDALEDNTRIYRYARANYHPGPDENWRNQYLGGDFRSQGSTLGWLIAYTAWFPGHENTRRIQSLRTDPDTDNGKIVDYVLQPGVAVKGHWIGARADCLYRAPE